MNAWLGAFALTQLVEAPIYAHALRWAPSWPARVGLACLPSALTHPLLWLAFPELRALLPYAASVVVLEALVVGLEAGVLFALLRHLGRAAMDGGAEGASGGRPRTSALAGSALRLSLLANTASVGASLVTRALFGWP